MPHTATRLLAVAAAGSLATFPLMPAHAANNQSNGNSNGKQTICHATNSNTNPYVVITPNKNGDVSGHAKHTGPVWNAGLKAQHVSWGDIIPPFDYNDHGTAAHYSGLNWTDEGRAIFANGCAIPTGGGGSGTTGGTTTGGTTGTTTGGSTGGTTGGTTGTTTGGTTGTTTGGGGGGGTTGATTGETTGGTTAGTTAGTTSGGFGGGGTTGAVSAPGGGSGTFTGGGGAVTGPTAAGGGTALPFTGLPTAAALATGLSSVAGGAVLLLLARRRRTA